MNSSLNQGGIENSGHGSDVLSGDRAAGAATARVREWIEGLGGSDFFGSLGAFDDGGGEHGSEMESVDDQEAGELTYDPDQERALAALEDLSNLGRKKTKREERLRALTEEDFETPQEKLCFRAIRENVLAIIDTKKPQIALKAAEWIFKKDISPINFDTICQVLTARPDVVRLRIQYELWRRAIAYSEPFPFAVTPLPEVIEGEIFMIGDSDAIQLAKCVWRQPGIRHADLMSTLGASDKKIDSYTEILQRLSARYLFSQYLDRWYVTGKNPYQRLLDTRNAAYRLGMSQVSWSEMF
ncbi:MULTISPECIES: hypothetical protein [Herbaspirillum]|uniref:Uncharacterized protein n=2 Tax=Herbaspirillum huttiense TaxID=863372 RepID=A0AAJ2HAH4_9BURK|nr:MULTISPECIES: hypothetical protein [Herbaspirillum]MDR9837057.1 hypothetical protein [Herbaspirillum huttiense]